MTSTSSSSKRSSNHATQTFDSLADDIANMECKANDKKMVLLIEAENFTIASLNPFAVRIFAENKIHNPKGREVETVYLPLSNGIFKDDLASAAAFIRQQRFQVWAAIKEGKPVEPTQHIVKGYKREYLITVRFTDVPGERGTRFGILVHVEIQRIPRKTYNKLKKAGKLVLDTPFQLAA